MNEIDVLFSSSLTFKKINHDLHLIRSMWRFVLIYEKCAKDELHVGNEPSSNFSPTLSDKGKSC